MAVYNKDGTRIDSGGSSGGAYVPDESLNWYDKICKAINHRGWRADGAVENTIAAYKASKAHGFYYVETDVRYTSDGYAVLYHDDYIDGVYVNNMTYAELLEEAPTLALFDDFIALCRNIGLHPYIEFKGNHTNAQVKALVDTVFDYQMQRKCTWFGVYSNVSKVMGLDASARLGILANTPSTTDINNLLSLKTGTNEVFLDAWIDRTTSDIIEAAKAAKIPLELYTFGESTSQILSLDPYVTGYTANQLMAGKVMYEAAIQ